MAGLAAVDEQEMQQRNGGGGKAPALHNSADEHVDSECGEASGSDNEVGGVNAAWVCDESVWGAAQPAQARSRRRRTARPPRPSTLPPSRRAWTPTCSPGSLALACCAISTAPTSRLQARAASSAVMHAGVPPCPHDCPRALVPPPSLAPPTPTPNRSPAALELNRDLGLSCADYGLGAGLFFISCAFQTLRAGGWVEGGGGAALHADPWRLTASAIASHPSPLRRCGPAAFQHGLRAPGGTPLAGGYCGGVGRGSGGVCGRVHACGFPRAAPRARPGRVWRISRHVVASQSLLHPL